MPLGRITRFPSPIRTQWEGLLHHASDVPHAIAGWVERIVRP